MSRMIKLLIVATLLEGLLYAGMAVYFFLDDQPAPGAMSSAVTAYCANGARMYWKYEINGGEKDEL